MNEAKHHLVTELEPEEVWELKVLAAKNHLSLRKWVTKILKEVIKEEKCSLR